MTKSALRTSIASVVILGFATYVYFGEFQKSHDDQKKKELDTMLLPNIAADQVSHVEWWTGPNESFAIDKKEGSWTVAVARPLGDPSHAIKDRANAGHVEEFLKNFLLLRSTETVVKGLFDEKTFGLDMPMFEVKFSQTSGSQLHGVRIGSVKAYDASLYAQVDDDKAVFLVPSSALELFHKDPNDFREHALYRETKKTPWTSISMTKDGRVVLSLKLKAGVWISEANPNLTLDTAAVEAYLKRIENIQGIDFTYENHEAAVFSDHDLKPFKLDHPHFLVDLKDEAGQTWQLRLSSAKDEAAESTSGAMRASVLATASGVPAIAKVLDQNLNILDKRAEDFVRTPKPPISPKASPKGHS